MSTNTDRFAKTAPPGKLWLWTLRVVALAALLIAGYLTVIALNKGSRPAGCGPDSACGQVLSSPWSKWLRVVPVSAVAVVLYALTIATTALLVPGSSAFKRRRGWIMLTLTALMIVGAVIWFTVVQGAVIGGWCPWCMADHGLGLTVAVMILFRVPMARGRPEPSGGALTPSTISAIVVVALLAVAAVPVGQILLPAKVSSTVAWVDDGATAVPPPLIDIGGRKDGIIWLHNGKVRFVLDEPLIPLIGPADAEFVMLELFDYCCGHCRQMQARIKAAQARYGVQLAVAIMPVPLNAACNRSIRQTQPDFAQSCDLTRLSLAVWSADRASFTTMHEWLMEGEKPPSTVEARARAVGLVGQENLEVALTDPAISQRIDKNMRTHVRTYGQDKKFTFLPKIILRRTVFTGVPSEEVVFQLLEKYHGVKPPGGEADAAALVAERDRRKE